ncbi:hypothetical protein DCCM_2273 [Desulfocucumis palustris]|uniref:Serine dehydrogenase proteinase n=1 Tax=Desulfocucumis palustris TaxID=1898651 RepID=A0A2L2XG15_9FIRM|nr:hypothetical protein [Desulfocucumis palustris]GBF33176.1 hypothetical protein DCCM_2273 [Desulfocucumis palustris]
MTREERLALIRQLEEVRGSTVICYITGDRENVNTRIAPDVIPVLYKHLEQAENRDKIELFLYTRGGDVLTPWRMVHLVREYTEHFNVLVPYRATSAGTLICLGANEIVMTKMGELGPIDPSVVNAFNPQDPVNPAARVPVNVEDVYSYLALAKEKGGLSSDTALAQAFTLLAEHIHPLALGNVHRNYLLIRSLAYKMLRLRCNFCEPDKLKNIVNNLTEKLYAHNHMISRREAVEEIGLHVTVPPWTEEKMMWELYRGYAGSLKLEEPFNPAEMLQGERTEFEVAGGMVESARGLDAFTYKGVVERVDYADQDSINVNILKQGWITII